MSSSQRLGIVATYPLVEGRGEKKIVSSKRKKRGSRHQCLSEENVRKTKKRSANIEKKGSGVVYV